MINKKNLYDARSIFFLVREMFKIIKDSRIGTVSNFYTFVLDCNDEKKAEATYSNLVSVCTSDAKKYSSVLKKYGISEEYFEKKHTVIRKSNNNLEDAICKINAYLDDPKCKDKKEFIDEVIIPNIFEFKNLDGSLIIDCVRQIVWDIYTNQATDDEYAFGNSINYKVADYVKSLSLQHHVSQKQMREYYKTISKELLNQENNDVKYLSSFPDEDRVDEKHLYNGKSEVMANNLLLIREGYYALAENEHVENALDKFYDFFDISEAQYSRYLSGDMIPVMDIIEKFEPMGYPASLFRTDSPTLLTASTQIINAVYDSRINKDINILRNVIKLYLTYCIDTRNLIYFFASYHILSEIMHKNHLL